MIPNVSIITPAYNRAHTLPRVWNSLCSQTEQNFQWIVVDDGSTDNTKEVISGFNDPRIVYVYQDNAGCNGARNRGDQEIKAEFVVYLDSDDEFFNTGSLTDMLHAIRATRPEIAWVSFTCVDEHGQKVSHLEVDQMEANYLDHVCRQKFWGELFNIYRSDVRAISSWPSYRGFQSLRHLRIARQRPTLMINRPARIYYRQHGDNLSSASATLSRAASMVEATTECIEEHKSAWLNHCPSQFGKYSFHKSVYLALSGPIYLALPSLFHALRYGKWDIRRKVVFLFLAGIVPLSLRKKLFLWRDTWRNRLARK